MPVLAAVLDFAAVFGLEILGLERGLDLGLRDLLGAADIVDSVWGNVCGKS